MTAPHREKTAVRLMDVVTRSAARLVQTDLASVRTSPRVVEATAAVTEAASEAREALCGSRGDGTTPVRTAPSARPPASLRPASPETEAVTALDRMRWALQQIAAVGSG